MVKLGHVVFNDTRRMTRMFIQPHDKGDAGILVGIIADELVEKIQGRLLGNRAIFQTRMGASRERIDGAKHHNTGPFAQRAHLLRFADGAPTRAKFAIPKQTQKADVPTVCFIGRFDRVKRPELFFQLVRHFPDVQFVAAGASQDDSFARELSHYSNLPNLEMTGFINQFTSNRLSEIFEGSWILINTSAKEALPNSFVEACAHKCAILSEFDPDGFTSNFGYLVKDGDFIRGLECLLENDMWKRQGQKGYEYVKNVFENDKVINLHLP
jgi:glycosyltransferase involved in cell wall biosynthesis